MQNNATNRALAFMFENGYTGIKTTKSIELKELIYSPETIKRWSHSRRHKVIIDTMTYSFVGKLIKKGYIYQRLDKSIYITKEGIEYIKNQYENIH
jgi:predicted transcriptional regulator